MARSHLRAGGRCEMATGREAAMTDPKDMPTPRTVTRYSLKRDHVADCYCDIEACGGGTYVHHDDYVQLERELSASRAIVERAVGLLDAVSVLGLQTDGYRKDMDFRDEVDNVRAFLAEIRERK